MLVTKAAPDFKAQAVMPDNSFKEVSFVAYHWLTGFRDLHVGFGRGA